MEVGTRIALLTNGLFPWVVGGMQKHSSNLIREWAMMGVDLDVYFTQAPVYPALAEIQEALVPNQAAGRVRFIDSGPSWLPYFPFHHYADCYIESCRMAEQLMRESAQAEFIYVQGYEGLELFRTKRNGKPRPPIGLNLHGVHAWQQSWFSAMEVTLKLLCRPMERFMLRNCDVALSLGGRIDDIIRKVAPGIPIIRSANGISPDWLSENVGDFHTPLRLVFVGRDEKAKGLHILCDVLRQMQLDQRVELHVVSVISKDKRLNAPWIIYHGGIQDEKKMRDLLRQMDVLVNPSRTEGVPTVVLEGMASGLAIIATDVGATCDLVGNDNGWLIELDSGRALREALTESMAESPELLKRRKSASLEKVRKFLWPAIAAATLHGIETFVKDLHRKTHRVTAVADDTGRRG